MITRKNIFLKNFCKQKILIAYIEHLKQVSTKQIKKSRMKRAIGLLAINNGADNKYVNALLNTIDTLYDMDLNLIA